MATKQTLSEVWTFLCSALEPRMDPRVAARQAPAYAQMLEDIDDAMLWNTVRDGVATIWTFPRVPTPAEIRKHWTTLRVRIAKIDPAEEAWGKVFDRLNAYRDPVYESSLVEFAVRATGGWRMLCLMQQEEIAPNRKRFIDAYNSQLDRIMHDATMRPQERLSMQLHLHESRGLVQIGAIAEGRKLNPVLRKKRVNYIAATREEFEAGKAISAEELRRRQEQERRGLDVDAAGPSTNNRADVDGHRPTDK